MTDIGIVDPDAAPTMAATAPPAGIAWPKPLYAWYVVILLNLSNALAILDRIVIGLMVDPIKRDLGATDTQMGLLQGLAFALFYTLFSFPIGYLVDRWNRVRLLTAGVLVWSAATIASGFATSFGALFAARISVGAGEATVNPVATSLIGDVFRAEQRGKAFGILNLGGTFGTALAYVLGGAAIAIAAWMRGWGPAWFSGYRDWHLVYMMIGLPGIVVALLLLTIREPLRREQSRPAGSGASIAETMAHMRRHWLAYVSIILGAVLSTMIISAAIAWFPTLIIRVYGWTPARVGASFGLIGLPCGAISAISGGWLLSWATRKGRLDGPILVVLLQSGFWLVFGTLKSLAPSPGIALIFHVFTSLAAVWSVTAILAGLVQITPNEMRGQIVAIYTVVSGLIGLTLGTAVVGMLSDHVFTWPTGIMWSLATVYFVGAATSIAILLIGRRAFIRAAQAATAWATPA